MVQAEVAAAPQLQAPLRARVAGRLLLLAGVGAFGLALTSLQQVWLQSSGGGGGFYNSINPTGQTLLDKGTGILFPALRGVSLSPLHVITPAVVIGAFTMLAGWTPTAIERWRVQRYAALVPLACGVAGLLACNQAIHNFDALGTSYVPVFLAGVTITARSGPGPHVGLALFAAAVVIVLLIILINEVALRQAQRAAA